MDPESIKIEQILTLDQQDVARIVVVDRYTILTDDTLDDRKIVVEYSETRQVPFDVITLLRLTDHTNILKLFLCINSPLVVYSPYLELKLSDLIYTKTYLYPDNEITSSISKKYLINQLVNGVAWLHDNKIFHGFLNPQVVYLENYYTVKISGFYFSEIFKDPNQLWTRDARSWYYSPNPLLESNRQGFKYDIWCLGRVIFEFIFRENSGQLFEYNFNNNWDDYFREKGFIDSDVELFKHYINFVNDNPGSRPFLDGNIAERNLELLNNDVEREFDQFINGWFVEDINNNIFTKIITNKLTGEMRCLKLRPFQKNIYDFERELSTFKDPLKQHEQFAVAYLADVASNHKPFIWLMTEYAQHGCLKKKMKLYKKTGFPPEELEFYVKELIRILALMHEKNIIHRNLKPTNVLLVERNNQITLRFSDFYMAKSNVVQIFTNHTPIPKSPYTAPELFDQETYGKPVDVWSVGCIIHEMKCMRREYNGITIPNRIPNNLENEQTENDPILTLCKRMIVLNPNDRAKADEL